MHGHFFDSLSELSGGLEAGIDGFEMWQRRVDLVIDAVIERGLVAPGRIVFMGSSRHGFAVLYGTARNEKIDAAVVIGPVIYWPWLKEFEGMDDHPLIRKHDLYDLVDRLPPRSVQVQQGYADVRIGQHHNERLAVDVDRSIRVTRDVGAADAHTDGDTRALRRASDAREPDGSYVFAKAGVSEGTPSLYLSPVERGRDY